MQISNPNSTLFLQEFFFTNLFVYIHTYNMQEKVLMG